MAIPEHKMEELRAAGFDPEELETKLEAERENVEGEKREAKEVEPEPAEEPAAEEAVEEPTPEPEAGPDDGGKDEPAPEAPATQPLTVEDIAQSFQAAIAPLIERMDAVETQFKTLKEEQVQREEKELEEKLEMTPAASLKALMRSAVIGHAEARVDGRKARHEGPQEAAATQANTSGIGLVDAMRAGKDWREAIKQ